MSIKKMCNEEKNDFVKNTISESDKTDFNGLLFEDKYIPEEVMIKILTCVDHNQLLICQLVCKRWNALIKEYVWRKKAELMSNQIIQIDDNISWTVYYFICSKNLFNRNLLLSFCTTVEDEDDSEANSKYLIFDKDDKNPPIDVLPFPEEIIFDGKIHCVINYGSWTSKKKFVIDLLQEGFTKYFLDNLQPTIKISAWYCCKWEEFDATCDFSVKLVRDCDSDCSRIMRAYHFNKILKNTKGQWLKFTYTLKNYGEGLRWIKFYQGGKKQIIAGACVKLEMPVSKENNKSKDE